MPMVRIDCHVELYIVGCMSIDSFMLYDRSTT